MQYVTSDPLSISLLLTLSGVGLEWDDITETDDSDASYKRALEILICAGYVDAKVEVTVEMQGRLGQIHALYHCHGGCDVLLNEDAQRHAHDNPEWLDGDDRLAAGVVVKKRILAVRLSARSIEKLKLDRPNEKLAVLPILIEKLLPLIASNQYWDQSPSVELLDISLSARNGPDPDHVGVFYWRGQGRRLTKRNWQLLCAIYGHPAVDISEAGELVWGSDLTLESTVRKQVNRMNEQLAQLDIPLAWRIEASQLIPEAK